MRRLGIYMHRHIYVYMSMVTTTTKILSRFGGSDVLASFERLYLLNANFVIVFGAQWYTDNLKTNILILTPQKTSILIS